MAATETPPPPTAADVKTPVRTGVMATLLLVMITVSASVAIYSAWLLIRGEKVPIALEALPADCVWVVQSDLPGELAGAWRAMSQHPALPDEMAKDARGLQELLRDLAAVPGLARGGAWAVCGLRQGAVAALPDAGGGLPMARAWFDRLRAAPWPRMLAAADVSNPLQGLQSGTWSQVDGRAILRDDQGRSRAAVSQEQGVVLVAWSYGDVEATAVLDESRVAASRNPLKEDEEFRAAIERAGGGQLHLYIGGEAARVFARRTNLGHGAGVPPWQPGLPSLRWLGVALRSDATGVRIHAHLGTTEKGAAWLKQTFDVTGVLDAAPYVDAQATVVGVVRLPLATWAAWGSLPGQLPTELSKGLTGQAIWQELPAAGLGSEATPTGLVLLQVRDAAVVQGWLATRRDNPQPAGMVDGFLVIGTDRTTVGRGEALVRKARKLDGVPELGPDTKRLLSETQGLLARPGAQIDVGKLRGWRGPLEAEWLWLDTGLIGELRLLPVASDPSPGPLATGGPGPG
jgi:hypothetical protein